MAWTQEDVDKLRAALLKLASGEAVQTVSYNGPPARSVTYQQANLPDLWRTLATVQAEVNAAAGVKPYRFAAHRKGF